MQYTPFNFFFIEGAEIISSHYCYLNFSLVSRCACLITLCQLIIKYWYHMRIQERKRTLSILSNKTVHKASIIQRLNLQNSKALACFLIFIRLINK